MSVSPQLRACVDGDPRQAPDPRPAPTRSGGATSLARVWEADGPAIFVPSSGLMIFMRPSRALPRKPALRKCLHTEHFPTAGGQCTVPCQGSLLPPSSFL